MCEIFLYQQTVINKAFKDYGIATGFVFVISVLSVILVALNQSLVPLLVLIGILGCINGYLLTVTVGLWRVWCCYRLVSSGETNTQVIDCRGIRCQSVMTGRFSGEMIAVIFVSNQGRYRYVFPASLEYTKELSAEYRARYVGKQVTLVCYQDSCAVHSIKDESC